MLKTYQWSGYLQSGLLQHGLVDANSITIAKDLLKKQGILVRSIGIKRSLKLTAMRVKSKHVAHFCQQLSSLLHANIPLTQAIYLCQSQNQTMQKIAMHIQQDLENGQSFAFALRKHPKVFIPLWCDLIDIGEQSGVLCLMLKRIVHHQEKTASLKRKFIKILTYPLLILSVTLFVVICFVLEVIPQFETIFSQFDATLPPFTLTLLKLSHHLKTYGGLYICLFFIGLWIFHLCMRNMHGFAQYIEKITFSVPIFGHLRKQVIIARLSYTLCITQQAGLSIIKGLDAAALASGSKVYYAGVLSIKEQILQGDSLHVAMSKSRLFPKMMTELIHIGEESATISNMFDKIAAEYEHNVSHLMDTLGALLEPIIMAILGVLVGGLVIALYLPIINLSAIV